MPIAIVGWTSAAVIGENKYFFVSALICFFLSSAVVVVLRGVRLVQSAENSRMGMIVNDVEKVLMKYLKESL